MGLGLGQESFDQIVSQSTRQRFESMQHRRRGENFAAFAPARALYERCGFTLEGETQTRFADAAPTSRSWWGTPRSNPTKASA